MAKVDLRKTVYNKDQFSRAVGGIEFTTFGVDLQAQQFSIEDFFNEYENLFLSIPINGPSNSHEFLVRKSSELVGFQRNTDDIQPLLDEITNLRDQLLLLQQQNIDLQVGDVNANKLQDQFNDLLQALSEPIEFPDIIIADTVNDEDTDDEDQDTEDAPVVAPVDDVIVVSIDKDREISRGSVNVLSNDVSRDGTPLSFDGIKDPPTFGKIEVIDTEEGIIQYIPDLRAPSGQKADSFTYIVSDTFGNSEVGTVYVNIKNDYILVTQADDDALLVTIGVEDQSRPNDTYFVQDNIINVLENDEGLDLEYLGIVTPPRFGTLTGNNGILTYQPRIGLRPSAGEIDLGAFFTPGAGIQPVTEDSFTYRIRNLNRTLRTDIGTVTVNINVLDSSTGVDFSPVDEDDNQTDSSTGGSSSTNSSTVITQ